VGLYSANYTIRVGTFFLEHNIVFTKDYNALQAYEARDILVLRNGGFAK
jgi:hypothetical protein